MEAETSIKDLSERNLHRAFPAYARFAIPCFILVLTSSHRELLIQASAAFDAKADPRRVAGVSNPLGFQVNFITIFLIGIIVYLLFDALYGTYITLANGTLSRTDNFFMKKKILISDIDLVRYQPTYGTGKEISSLYIFLKGADKASITMTSIWFTEPVLQQIVRDLKNENPLYSTRLRSRTTAGVV